MRRVVDLLATAALAYLVLVGGLWTLQRSLLFLPDRSLPSRAEAGVPEMREVRLRTSDGLELLSWYAPAAAGRGTIVYLHGNGGHIGYRGRRVRPFLEAGWGLLLVGWRGYGGNAGSPSEAGLLRDGRAALAFLAEQGIAPQRVVLYGESLGSAVAVALAAEQARAGAPVAALVLESPMSSVADVAAHHYPWVPVRPLLKDRFEAQAQVAEVAAPLLVVHGDADRVVPIRYGRALYEAAREPKQAVWIRGGGHENLAEFGLQRLVLDFLDRTVPVR